jgi:serine/threonine protein kinase
MSPEMLMSLPYATKVDCWSLGVVAYVMLFGEFPYTLAEKITAKSMNAAIVAGVPSPRFEPKASLLMGCINKISPEATDLTRRLLEYDPRRRPTAEEALEHIWVNSRENRPQFLRPMLHSAKRAGAFDTRNVQDSGQNDRDRFMYWAPFEATSRFMAHQQAKYLKTPVNAQKRRG